MSKIDWTDVTWNVTAGCRKVSEGCRNCWAIRTVPRLAGNGVKGYEQITNSKEQITNKSGKAKKLLNWSGKIELLEHNLQKPFKYGKKPKRVFVNSMSDLFHEDVPFDFVDKVMAVISLFSQHTFMILTKRPERMKEYFEKLFADYTPDEIMEKLTSLYSDENFLGKDKPFPAMEDEAECFAHNYAMVHGILSNLWLGVSVEDQKTADERIPVLLQIPAAKHFISLEPMLGAVDLSKYLGFDATITCHEKITEDVGKAIIEMCNKAGAKKLLDWVIVGGESGAGARPMHPEWVRSIKDQCTMSNVQFYFKQWGAYSMLNDKVANVKCKKIPHVSKMRSIKGYSDLFIKVGKKEAGHLLDGIEYRQIPDVKL